MIAEKGTRTDTLCHVWSCCNIASNPHLYLSIVTQFRSLRARGFEFGPSLNKFGVGVSRETKKHNLFALFR